MQPRRHMIEIRDSSDANVIDATLHAVKVTAVAPSSGSGAPNMAVATGTGAITLATAIIARPFKLNNVTLHLSAAPTTSETLTISLDAFDGPAYDTVLYSVNPATERLTDLLFQPDQPLLFKAGDQIAIAFTNTDGRTYGARISAELV